MKPPSPVVDRTKRPDNVEFQRQMSSTTTLVAAIGLTFGLVLGTVGCSFALYVRLSGRWHELRRPTAEPFSTAPSQAPSKQGSRGGRATRKTGGGKRRGHVKLCTTEDATNESLTAQSVEVAEQVAADDPYEAVEASQANDVDDAGAADDADERCDVPCETDAQHEEDNISESQAAAFQDPEPVEVGVYRI